MALTHIFFLFKFIFLGFVQGITEPLPISSSGHSIIFKDILSIQTPGLSFEIIVHIGSLAAICFAFRKDLLYLIKGTSRYILYRDLSFKSSFIYAMYLLIATFITGVIGILIEPIVTTTLAKPLVVGLALIITGSLLWSIRHLHGHKHDEHITLKDAFIIGLVQSFALIPGISRSGTTVAIALLLGIKKTAALRFSFLLFIPVGFGVTLLSLQDIIQDRLILPLIIPYFLAFLTAMMTTYFALKWFIHVMKKGQLKIFALYCFIIGISTFIFQLLKY